MGNMCVSKESREMARKFERGDILSPCHAHSQVRHQKKYARPRLIGAVEDGHLHCVKALVEAGADVNLRWVIDDSCTPIHIHTVLLGPEYDQEPSLSAGHVAAVKTLLVAGADVSATDGYKGRTPLHNAAEHGHWECVQLILDHGGAVNQQDKDGCTPLMKATLNGRLRCIQVLVAAGADVNMANHNSGKTPLHSLAEGGYHTCLQYLIQHGADIHKPNEYGGSVLSTAAYHKATRCVELLLEAGADVNRVNTRGGSTSTALLQASVDTNGYQSPYRCIRAIIRAGARVDVRDEYGMNPIAFYVTIYRPSRDVIDDCVMLLYAAGETLEGAEVNRYHCSWRPLYSTPVPNYIIQLRETATLKEAVRLKLRRHLLDANLNENLFIVVQKLPLPTLLKSYLVFEVSID